MKKTWVSTLSFIILMVTAVAWAAPVPDTGQTICYGFTGNVITCPSPGQPLYGQDGNYSINPPSYTKLDGSGNALPNSATSWVTVRDNVTGLIWENKKNKDGVKDYTNPNDSDNIYTWYELGTTAFLATLNGAHFGGYNDWRIPTVEELGTIVNYSIPSPGPTIDVGYFPSTSSSNYWTSTNARTASYAWCVSFGSGGDRDGYNYFYDKSSSVFYVRAVRGGQSDHLAIGSFDSVDNGLSNDASADAGSYTDNGDGTVTDTSTGLRWQQAGSNKTWEQALAYCEGLDISGYTDWRLPTIKELRGLVDFSKHTPSINTI